MKRKMWLFVLSLLGFQAACDKEEEPVQCMYGTPNIDFTVSGTVRNGAGDAIPGIKVSQFKDINHSATSDTDGKYEYAGIGETSQITLYFVDVDGEANGGDFATRELAVSFTDGNGDWSNCVEGVDVVLENKVKE